ncbi:D-alanyl-D-alanine carboxypeptidase family protein [Bradyrhizobium sp. SYSU BS000235]|uniref:D-alanyl-D-alanine carboxypeptidase family protein n=1 Tax=Bradyrhizobium sp. SYSU BS000235 TaxID=3411332 RepID=UPI003C74C4A3
MALSPTRFQWLSLRALICVVALVAALVAPQTVRAEALLVIEADTGKVLQAENATYPWYPASVTKLMTLYVTLKAVKEGRITLDTLFTVSPTALSQAPSKMGFPVGTQVTVDNAVKMMMVKSANDIAVVLAEGVGGSIDNFAEEMNKNAQRLGMTQTHYVNPNGLPADGHVTSARDLGILARALLRDFPEYEYYLHIPAIKFGRRITANFNKLIGRYPGADGMKTGFICASGFNLVASATRNNKRLIAVVLGASSGTMRAVRAAQLLERGFNNRLSWLKPSLGTVDSLAPIDAAPPNLRDEMCGPKRKRPAAEDEDDDVAVTAGNTEGGVSMFTSGFQAHPMKISEMIAAPANPVTPIIVYTGPTRTGDAVLAADAAETAKQSIPRRKGAKAKAKLAKQEAGTEKKDDAKQEAKSSAKPVASAKPAAAHGKSAAGAASAAKPATTAAVTPAKPDKKAETAAKPHPAKPAPAKPAAAKTGKPAATQQKSDTAPRS